MSAFCLQMEIFHADYMLLTPENFKVLSRELSHVMSNETVLWIVDKIMLDFV